MSNKWCKYIDFSIAHIEHTVVKITFHISTGSWRVMTVRLLFFIYLMLNNLNILWTRPKFRAGFIYEI